MSEERTDRILILEQENEKLKMTVKNLEGRIAQLEESDRELKRFRGTRIYRFYQVTKKAREKLVPQSSRRGAVVKLAGKFARHPVRCLRRVDISHIQKFLHGVREGSIDSVSARLDNYLGGRGETQTRPELIPILQSGRKADYPAFHVPMASDPLVSILVPTYNQFEYTYACLKSIALCGQEVPYEVLIADDCSTDLTENLEEIITGVRIIRSKENRGFLKNCNQASEQARGKYLLFLNNDTQVTAGWLQPLTDLMEKDIAIGLAGCKLIYPDGKLQEAGGIVWKDGTAWNFGHGQNPSRSEFNYVKDVDYVSGAAMMIRRSLWEALGGFDSRFAPAYYEDTDLAFRVRKAGYRVTYQPRSQVIHFEGMSNGKETTQGTKAYQEVNRHTFLEKWKEILEQEHNENGKDVFLARDRSIGEKRMLVVDHYVPMPDKDAGSRYILDYIRLFLKQGIHVTFIGNSWFPNEPYTGILQQMGVEVIYGDWYAGHWKEWIRETGQYFQYVVLSRPHIAIQYIQPIRQACPGKIFYMGHDLHFWREEMRFEKTGSADAEREAKKWKKMELALMREADVSVFPSHLEVEKVSALDPSISVRRWPINICYDVKDVLYRISDRAGLLFVGGFTHEPNVDAVHWAAETVMPLVWKKRKDIVLHVVGSNMPAEVRQLGREGICIHGYLTEAELNELYRTCRMELVPLRYGGGVKGKVIEAMRYGLPIVTTSVGTQGLIGTEGILMTGDTAEELAEKIVSWYDNETYLKECSERGVEYVRKHFSEEQILNEIKTDFLC